MSSTWHWAIAIITLANILACFWLILWSSRQGDAQKADDATLDHTWDGNLQERNNPLPRWWLFMFIGSILFGLGYLIYFPGLGAFKGTAGWSQVSQYEAERDRIDAVYQAKFESLAALDVAELTRHAEGMDIAGRLFGANCATCHGSDGRGAVGFPNLADSEWIFGNSPAVITQTIVEGRVGAMPPWQDALGDDGVREVVAYVKSLSGLPHVEREAEAGKAHYDMLCVACHMADGSGMQALGAPSLKDDVWLYGSSAEAITHSVALGRAGVIRSARFSSG